MSPVYWTKTNLTGGLSPKEVLYTWLMRTKFCMFWTYRCTATTSDVDRSTDCRWPAKQTQWSSAISIWHQHQHSLAYSWYICRQNKRNIWEFTQQLIHCSLGTGLNCVFIGHKTRNARHVMPSTSQLLCPHERPWNNGNEVTYLARSSPVPVCFVIKCTTKAKSTDHPVCSGHKPHTRKPGHQIRSQFLHFQLRETSLDEASQIVSWANHGAQLADPDSPAIRQKTDIYNIQMIVGKQSLCTEKWHKYVFVFEVHLLEVHVSDRCEGVVRMDDRLHLIAEETPNPIVNHNELFHFNWSFQRHKFTHTTIFFENRGQSNVNVSYSPPSPHTFKPNLFFWKGNHKGKQNTSMKLTRIARTTAQKFLTGPAERTMLSMCGWISPRDFFKCLSGCNPEITEHLIFSEHSVLILSASVGSSWDGASEKRWRHPPAHTQSCHFDENGVQLTLDHLVEQFFLAPPPQKRQHCQTQPATSAVQGYSFWLIFSKSQSTVATKGKNKNATHKKRVVHTSVPSSWTLSSSDILALGMITDHFLSHLTDFWKSTQFPRYGPKMNIFSIDLIDEWTFPAATAPSILCVWLWILVRSKT